jgi:hypothetical protein
VPENMDDIHSMIWANQRISAKKTAQTVEISRECVAFIIHTLDIRKLSAKWAPKCLYEVEKHDRIVAASQEIFEHFRWTTASLLAQTVTMYETWRHLCDPERQKNNLRSRNTCPKKFRTQKSASKVMAPCFWDKDGILLAEYLKKGATMTTTHLTWTK